MFQKTLINLSSDSDYLSASSLIPRSTTCKQLVMASSANMSYSLIRATEAFEGAGFRLRAVLLKESNQNLSVIQTPTSSEGGTIEEKAGQLESVVETFLQSRRELRESMSKLRKFKVTMRNCFKVIYPFTNLLLTTGKSATVCF